MHSCTQIVPTEYRGRSGRVLETNQYSVSEYALPLLAPGAAGHGKRDPFVNLVYDLSPIVARVQQAPLGAFHFLVRLCAVVGGALSLTKLLDGAVHGALAAAGAPEARACRGSSRGGAAASCGGGFGGGAARASCGGGAAFDGALPTSQRASLAGAAGGGGGGMMRGSGAGSLLGSIGGALARHGSGGLLAPSSSGGGYGIGGSGGGGSSAGGGAAIPMASLSGLAKPGLSGFGSWSQVDGESGLLKKP